MTKRPSANGADPISPLGGEEIRKYPRDCVPWPKGERVKRLNLALQGGGSHGAFTWGVLDRLLQDEAIEIDGVSGTSAGAVNAVALAHGLAQGGREGARRTLAELWRKTSQIAAFTPLQPSLVDRALGVGRMDFSPGYWFLDSLSRVFSPYQFNVFDVHPLREILIEMIDFEAIRRCRSIRLFVSATNIKKGRIKIFDLEEMSVDAVLASTCLPFLYPAVEIGEEAYWDGGYMGNPAIFPLIYGTDTQDVMIVQINPINYEEVPKTAQAILDRMNVVTFNSGLMREMRAVHFVQRLIDEGIDHDGRLKRMLIHVIEDEEALRDFGVSSKLNADWTFLQHLHDVGFQRCDDWLRENFANIGERDTVDLEEMYL